VLTRCLASTVPCSRAACRVNGPTHRTKDASKQATSHARCTLQEPLDLAAQLEKLRRDNHRTTIIFAFLIVALVTITLANHFQRPTSLEATEFLLKDSAGNVVARLGAAEFGGTCLTLKAKEHAADAQLCVHDDDGSYLALSNHHGDSRVSLSPGFTGYEPLTRFPAGLYIGQDLGKNFASLTLGTETKFALGHGPQNSILVSSPADKPEITLFSGEGKRIWSTH